MLYRKHYGNSLLKKHWGIFNRSCATEMVIGPLIMCGFVSVRDFPIRILRE